MARDGCNAHVTHGVWENEPAVTLSAGGYEATVLPGIGANLIALKHRKLEVDILRSPSSAAALKARPQVYGIPVLFPPNRIKGGLFRAGGRTYRYPVNEPENNNHLHGFLYDRPWALRKAGASGADAAEVELAYCNSRASDIFQYLPHEFTFSLTYRLSPAGLEQVSAIVNESDEPMPMGLGFHTAFRVPFSPGGRQADCRMLLSAGERWEWDKGFIPSGKKAALGDGELGMRSEGVSPTGRPIVAHYCADPLRMGERDFHGAILEDRGAGLKIVYEMGKEYKHWTIWNDTGLGGFICVEPQSWMIDAPNVGLPDETTGFLLLQPGEKWTGYSRIYVTGRGI